MVAFEVAPSRIEGLPNLGGTFECSKVCGGQNSEYDEMAFVALVDVIVVFVGRYVAPLLN